MNGTGFLNGATVLFGAVGATAVTFNSGTSLTAVAPAQAIGTVSVTVTNPDAKSAILNGAFQYFDHSSNGILSDGFESGSTSAWMPTP